MANSGVVNEGPRGLSFGAIADLYDRYRPSYPPQLVTDVLGLLPGRRVVEVGAGTGIATSQFIVSGLEMTCVEPDAQMAGVLARKLPEVDVVSATFEGWSAGRGPEATKYDGLISAQAWHWTAPQTRWRDAAEALRSGGVLALFWNHDGYSDPVVRNLIAQAYDRNGIEDRAVPAEIEDDPDGWPASEIDASVEFSDHDLRLYRWTRRQSVVDHVARLNTVSAHLILPATVREALTHDLLDSLTQYAGDEIELAMRTELALARRR